MANSQEIVIPKNFGQLSKVFGNVKVDNELSAGIQASYAVVKYRGKVWSVNYRGEENAVLRADGDGAASSIEVVIVKASPVVQKTYYIEGWQPGSSTGPDCFSNDGLRPEANSPHLQNDYCKTCKHNDFGTGPNGRGKACADSKRLVVVPVDDLRNEAYGGPMLLRVPAASLQNMAAYGDKLKQLGHVPYGVATRVSFDTKVTHPQFVFGAIRALRDDEAEIVQELRSDDRVDRILSLDHEDRAPQELKLEDVFEQPPEPKPVIKPNTELKRELKKEKENGPAASKPTQAAVVAAPSVAKKVEKKVEANSAGEEGLRGEASAESDEIGESAGEAAVNGSGSEIEDDLDAALSKLI